MSCAKCFSGAVHDHAEPQGHYDDLYGYRTYITGDKTATCPSVILYLPDVFSHKLVNNQLLADRYAAGTGCKVVFPDIVHQGGVDVAVLPLFETWLDKAASYWAKFLALLKLLPYVPFIVRGGPDKAFPAVLQYARRLRADLSPEGKLGVAGFCWGGYGSTLLCCETATEGDEATRLIDAQFCGHPSRLKTPDHVVAAVAKFRVPYSCAAAEIDPMLDERAAMETEAALRREVGPAEEHAWEVRVYKGAHHGFCVRAKPGHEADEEGYRRAARQAVDWFNKYLK